MSETTCQVLSTPPNDRKLDIGLRRVIQYNIPFDSKGQKIRVVSILEWKYLLYQTKSQIIFHYFTYTVCFFSCMRSFNRDIL